MPCRFCGAFRLVWKEGDETFSGRWGCLACDRWQSPVVLRRQLVHGDFPGTFPGTPPERPVSLHATGVSRSHRARCCRRPRWFIPYTVVTRWGWYTMVVEHDLTTPDGRAASPPGFAPSPHGTMHDGLQPAGVRLAR